MKLSYIITFHNGAKYISECIDSLYRQGLPESEFEVILVDDKSEDFESLAIIEKYRNYPNYRIIHNAVNLKQGESRNVGLRVAKGEYVWFIDQDDYIVDSCAGRLLEICMSKKLDILIFNYDIKREENCMRRSLPQMSESSAEVMTGLNYLEYVCDGVFALNNCLPYVWNKLFKCSFLREKGLFFPHFESEDDYLILFSMLAAGRVSSITDKCIVYRIHNDSFLSRACKKGYVICDWRLVRGTYLYDAFLIVPERYPKIRWRLNDDIERMVNSIAKCVLTLPRVEKRNFYNRFDDYKESISHIESYFSSRTQFILRHRKMVMNFPFTIRVFMKMSEILRGLAVSGRKK